MIFLCEVELIAYPGRVPEPKERSIVIRETSAPWLTISYLIR